MHNQHKESDSNFFQSLTLNDIQANTTSSTSPLYNHHNNLPLHNITTTVINLESPQPTYLHIPIIESHPEPLIKPSFEEGIDSIYDKAKSYILQEKAKVQRESEAMNHAKNYLRQLQKDERKLMKISKEKFLSQMSLTPSLKDSDIIDINISGTHNITTTRGTLTKFRNSALGILFSGQVPLCMIKGKYFIDREGEPFINLIKYLRNGKFPIFKTSIDEAKFYSELSFWNIPLYQEKCITPQFLFDILWCSNSLNLTSSSNKLIINKSNPHHEIACCIPCLGDVSTYIEFSIIINGSFDEKNQVFIGLIDKSKHKRVELISYAGKRCPLTYYWDILNSRLIKSVKNGTFIGYKGEYGCECKHSSMKVAMKYNFKARTITYYLNDINLGVAFTNVQSNLCPAVDMWFDSGKVEILLSKGQWKDKDYL